MMKNNTYSISTEIKNIQKSINEGNLTETIKLYTLLKDKNYSLKIRNIQLSQSESIQEVKSKLKRKNLLHNEVFYHKLFNPLINNN